MDGFYKVEGNNIPINVREKIINYKFHSMQTFCESGKQQIWIEMGLEVRGGVIEVEAIVASIREFLEETNVVVVPKTLDSDSQTIGPVIVDAESQTEPPSVYALNNSLVPDDTQPTVRDTQTVPPSKPSVPDDGEGICRNKNCDLASSKI